MDSRSTANGLGVQQRPQRILVIGSMLPGVITQECFGEVSRYEQSAFPQGKGAGSMNQLCGITLSMNLGAKCVSVFIEDILADEPTNQLNPIA